MAHDLFASEMRLLFIQGTESYGLIIKIWIFIDEYFSVPLSILDFSASRKKVFLHLRDNGPRDALP